ncbi:hypothetical protein CNMCM5878_001470 [Aspergillus fumigatiaffinis]|nr:hypothetical protein CNMCM5878_001470 [Aspergillus fumigatiaffinis]
MALAIPAEVCELVISHILTPDDFYWAPNRILPYTLEPDVRACLISLRLVSRTFCASASPQLFRHIVALAHSSTASKEPLGRLLEISQSPYSAYVRYVEVGHDNWSRCHSESHGQDVQDLAGLLSPCLARLSNLQAILFAASSDTLSRDHATSIISAFITALHYVPIPHLEALDVSFPLAYDFEKIFPSGPIRLRVPIESILGRLKYLRLHVSAHTNEQGQRYWRTPVLPAHAALPNDLYAGRLVDLTNGAPNLDSLSITSIDLLPLQFERFNIYIRLTSLSLTRVLLSSDYFLPLIRQSKDTLRHLQLHLLQLHQGTWDEVLSFMAQLTRLVDFSIGSCGYPSTGPNADLSALQSAPDDTVALETLNIADETAFERLRERVNTNRAAEGLRPFTNRDFRIY